METATVASSNKPPSKKKNPPERANKQTNDLHSKTRLSFYSSSVFQTTTYVCMYIRTRHQYASPRSTTPPPLLYTIYLQSPWCIIATTD